MSCLGQLASCCNIYPKTKVGLAPFVTSDESFFWLIYTRRPEGKPPSIGVTSRVAWPIHLSDVLHSNFIRCCLPWINGSLVDWSALSASPLPPDANSGAPGSKRPFCPLSSK